MQDQWEDVERIDQLGKSRDKKFAEWDSKYGKGNWRLVWKVNGEVLDFLGACALYEEAYYRFLKQKPEVLGALLKEASDIYDDAPSNIKSGLDYKIQETKLNHIQDIAIRNTVKRLGLRFAGKELIQIRDKEASHPLSMILSPGQVPFHDPGLIMKPEHQGWWKPGSVESFYQSNRILQARQKIKQYDMMENNNVMIIGIAGRSCSGKSTVIKALEKRYEGGVLHIDQDLFFKKNPGNQERPESLMFDQMTKALRLLKERKSAFIPKRPFTEDFVRKIEPSKIIIVGGHLLFVNKELNTLFNKKIWIDVSDINLLYRRLKKFNIFSDADKKTYEKYFGEVSQLDYVVNVVIPESRRYEKIQKDAADFVLDGNLPQEDLITAVENIMKT